MSRRVALLICGAAFALRLFALDASGFWYDEAFSAWIAAKDWAGILDFARTPKLEHPPVYYFLLHAWQAAAGDSAFALRFFSLGFSLLAVVLIYRLARRWFGASTAGWALLFAAASPFLIVYAQEARMYTLALCASLLAVDFFLRWLAGDGRAAAAYAFCTLLSISIHYYAALALVAEHLLVLFVRPRGRSFWSGWMAWNAALVLAALGVLAAAPGPRETIALVFSHPLFAGRSVEELGRAASDLLVGGVVIRPLTTPMLAATALMALPVAAGAGWVLRRSRWREPRYQMVLLLLVVPPLVAAAVPFIYAARYLFLTVPALILLSALAVSALRARAARFAALALVPFALSNVFGMWLNYGDVKSPYRDMALDIMRSARASDGLILTGPGQWPLASYYLRGPWERRYIPLSAAAAELVDIDADMRAMQQHHQRLWVVSEQASVIDPGNNVPRWLALNGYPIQRAWFKDSDAVALYASGASLLPLRVGDVQFGEWLVLEQAAASATAAEPGDILAVDLRWHALKKIPQPLQLLVTLRLLAPDDRIAAERVTKPCDGFCAIDDWVPGESVPDRHGLLIPAGAPPGEYRLQLSVYSPRQGADLEVLGGTSGVLDLARIRVGPPAIGR